MIFKIDDETRLDQLISEIVYLAQFGLNFRDILETDLKYMRDMWVNIENELAKLMQIAKSCNLFENKYFDTEPLTWKYRIGSNRRPIAGFLKHYFLRNNENCADLVASIQNRDVKVCFVNY